MDIFFQEMYIGDTDVLISSGGGQNLHDAARANRADGIRIEPGFGDPLGLEPVPVEMGTEVVLGVLAEQAIVLVGPALVLDVVTDTGQRQRLTSAPSIETAPSFSPDGSQIVFESDRSGSQQSTPSVVNTTSYCSS